MKNQKLIEDLMDLSIRLGLFVMRMDYSDPDRAGFVDLWELTLFAKEELQSYEGANHGE